MTPPWLGMICGVSGEEPSLRPNLLPLSASIEPVALFFGGNRGEQRSEGGFRRLEAMPLRPRMGDRICPAD